MDGTPRILAAGDQALLIEFGEEIKPAINRRVQAFTKRASQQRISGIGELVPSYCTVLIYYDPLHLSFSQAASWAGEFLSGGSVEVESTPTIKEVPVLYGGPSGPDLDFVAEHNGISVEEVIRFHTSQTYLVYVVGFSPGFTAMGTVPEKIRAPRHPNPTNRVPAGSVGIGGVQTGIYPVESPGGWRLIGRTPLRLFDLSWTPPSHFQAGDYARFYSISEEKFREMSTSEKT
jgi:KipI family sensor histidine kinase inhibitor